MTAVDAGCLASRTCGLSAPGADAPAAVSFALGPWALLAEEVDMAKPIVGVPENKKGRASGAARGETLNGPSSQPPGQGEQDTSRKAQRKGHSHGFMRLMRGLCQCARCGAFAAPSSMHERCRIETL
jgi:hypothetical protein